MSGVPPMFSVVIPTFNRPGPLLDLCRSLAEMDYPVEQYEIVVINDGGEALRIDELKGACGPVALTTIEQAGTGPALARNRGVGAARGKIIAFVDDDCTVVPEWLREYERNLEGKPDMLLGGRTAAGAATSVMVSAHQRLMEHLFRYYRPGDQVGGFFTSNNICAPKERFLALGGFDPSLRYGEDRDLCHRWIVEGGACEPVDTALVTHHQFPTFLGLLRQHFQYGRGTSQFWRRAVRKKASQPLRKASAKFVPRLLFSALINPDAQGRRVSLMLALLSMHMANYCGLLVETISTLAGRRPLRAPSEVSEQNP